VFITFVMLADIATSAGVLGPASVFTTTAPIDFAGAGLPSPTPMKAPLASGVGGAQDPYASGAPCVRLGLVQGA
jgi:hypothetical protein